MIFENFLQAVVNFDIFGKKITYRNIIRIHIFTCFCLFEFLT